MRRFLWNKIRSRHYLAQISWKRICLPKDQGGLGIKHLANWNKSFLLKLLWIWYQKQPLLWVDLLWAKYLHRDRLDTAEVKAHHSHFWKSLLSLKDHLLNNLFIKIGHGQNSSFWFDKWLPMGAPASQTTVNPPEICSHFRLSDFLHDGSWNLHTLQAHLIKQILQCKVEPQSTLSDKPIWHPVQEIPFSVANAYNSFHMAHTPLD